MNYNTKAEPYRAKVVEPIKLIAGQQREKCLEEAGYNVLLLKAKDVFIDLFTDSGTSAMSSNQWAGIMMGDESYAGSESFYELEDAVRSVFGYRHVLPAHQGRAAQNLLYHAVIKPGKYALSNTFYGGDIADRIGGITLNLVVDGSYDFKSEELFKGNINIQALEEVIDVVGPEQICAMVPVVTNNLAGGHPMSLSNLRQVRNICQRHAIPLYLDACRIIENAFFIKESELGCTKMTIMGIVREMASLSDGCIVSGKKDALCNIGGFMATNDLEVYQAALPLLLSIEGFTTYGGMAGRDLEALARGIYEATDEEYLEYRINQVRQLASELDGLGIPVVRPFSGSSVYIDAKAFMKHLSFRHLRAESLAAATYLEGGVRVSPFGQLMSGHTSPSDQLMDKRLGFLRKGVFANRENPSGEEVESQFEFVRLSIPRRVYSRSHMDFVREVINTVHRNRENIQGLEIEYQPRYYRFFSARMKPAGDIFWKR